MTLVVSGWLSTKVGGELSVSEIRGEGTPSASDAKQVTQKMKAKFPVDLVRMNGKTPARAATSSLGRNAALAFLSKSLPAGTTASATRLSPSS